MRRLARIALVAMLSVVSVSLFAQSLGEAARQARGEKKPTPKKVYTNDDFASVPQAPAPAPSQEAAGSDKPEAKTSDKDKKDAKTAANSDSDKAGEWKKKINGQQKTVADLERELNLMEREHQLRASSYYADIGQQLRDSKKWFEDERKYDEDHKAKEKAVADAKQKLEQLKEDARKAGIPAGQLD